MATKKRKAAELVVEMAGGVAKLATDMGKANQLIASFGKEVEKNSKILKAMFAFDIAKTIGPELLRLTGIMNRFAAEGEKVGSIRDAFEGLGGSTGSLKKAQEAVLGTVSAFDLMAVANQGLIRGIPQFNEKFGDLAEFAQRFADATGQETLPVLNQLTEALAKGKTKGLDPFGFALDSTWSKAKVQAEVYAQLQGRIDSLAPSLASVANEYAALEVQLKDVGREFGIGVNNSAELIAAYKGLRAEINGTDWEGLGASLATINAAFINLGTQILPTVATWISDIARGLDFITGTSRVAQLAQIQALIAKSKADLAEWNGPGDVIRKMTMRAQGNDPSGELEATIKLLELRQSQLIAEGKQEEAAAAERKVKIAKDAHDRELKFQADRDRIAAQSDAKRIHDNEMAELDAMQREWAERSEYDRKLRLEQEKRQKEADEKRFRDMTRSADELFGALGNLSQQLGLDLTAAFETATKFLSDKSKAAIGEWASALTGLSGSEIAAGLQAGGTVLDALINARRTDKANQDNSGTGAAVGSGAGAAIGAFWGPEGAAIGADLGNALGGLIGSAFKWGADHPETKARHAFANFVEEGFRKLGQVSFFDAAGKLQNVRGDQFNFLEGGSGRFNQPGWGDSMGSWGEDAKNTFLGLGEALKEVQGITEDVGGQIGFMLGEQLSGNIDNARLFVQQLGLSFEDLGAALEAAAKRGSISWHEFEVNLQGVSEAFKPGLEAFGDVAGAVNEIYDSGGRGQVALKGIRDLAQEVKDLGGSTIGDLQKFMEAQGVSADRIKTIIDSLQARGITSIDQLLGLDDRGAGGIIAEMYSQSEELAAQWDKMGESLKGITDTLKEMDEQLEKELTINVKANLDSQTQDLLNAGVFDGTGLETAVQQMKAAGSLNLGSVGSLSGASASRMASSARAQFSPTTINVDARGAAPGVSAEITNALASIEQRVVQSAIRAIYDARVRGE